MIYLADLGKLVATCGYLYSSQLPLQLRNNKKGSEFSVIPVPINVPKKIPSVGKSIDVFTLHGPYFLEYRFLPLVKNRVQNPHIQKNLHLYKFEFLYLRSLDFFLR